MENDNNIAVIGAGWAGLAAAVTLAARGVPVSVFEASRHLGGRARRVSLDTVDLDNGQHILIGAYGDTLAMMRAVGADPERLLLRLPLELRYADGFHLRAPRTARLNPPFNLIAALLGARGLGLAAAFGAARFMRALQSKSYRIAPDRSVAQLLAEHAQHGRLRSHLWEPLCVSALNTPADRASAQVFAHVLRDALTGARANSDLLIPRADLGTLFPQPAAHYVHARGGKLRPGVAVRSIGRGAGAGFVIDDRPERYRQVILAVAPQHAAALIAPLVAHCPALAATRKQIEGLTYEPIVTCYLQYPQGVSLGVPMLGFTGGMVQWAFDRGVIAGNGAAGRSGCGGLIAVVISASGAHQELGNDVLATRVHAEIVPSLKHAASAPPAPLWSRIIHEKRATFSCTPALERPPGATPQDGLWLAGDYVASGYPATLESAVRSGIAAAMGVIGR